MTTATTPPAPTVDAVVIGRNEGARLLACLRSLQGQVRHIVYVDSGSTDGSVEAAARLGARVVPLDMGQPFTAARARNAGIAALRDAAPEFIQFVDGDCTLDAGWINAALAAFATDDRLAVVCGRRRERFPGASVYNRLADREWDTPIGPARACGGDALMRHAPVAAMGGFRESLIAGEEPELCLRLRQAGWSILRIDAEMTLHDAAMTRFGQWWKRAVRAGHAFAEGASLHGRGPDRHWIAETRRALIWGAGLPLAILTAGLVQPALFGFLVIYPLQLLRLSRRYGGTAGLFLLLARFPEAQGALQFYLSRALGRRQALIEYK